MKGVDHESTAVAEVYARSLIGLAEAQRLTDTVMYELTELAGLAESDAEFARFLSSPMIDADARRATIEKLFRGRLCDLTVDAIQVLNRKERLGLLGAIAECYRLAFEALRGQVDVLVRTAIPLSEGLRVRVKRLADARSGKDAQLVESVDPSLIGGMSMKFGDEKFDATVATKLKVLSESFARRGSEAIHASRSAG
jgi:F-type H+-transporting ATPase subunit delta